jgi:hypothetical protein
MKKSLFAFALMICLSGCSSAYLSSPPGENSPLFQVPVGSRVVLAKEVEVPPGQNEVYFQNGQTMVWYKVDIYLPYCALKVFTRRETSQVIHPDEFTVEKSYQQTFFKQVQAPDEAPVIQPIAFGRKVDFDQGGNMEYQVVANVLELHSGQQPQVASLLCTDWGLPPTESHITLKKMRRALGSFVKIEIPSPGR